MIRALVLAVAGWLLADPGTAACRQALALGLDVSGSVDACEYRLQIDGLAQALDVKVKDFLAPLFVAIAGTSASFSVVDSMEMLGPDMSRARIRHAIEVLGGVSKKALKRLEKEYQALAW